MANARYWEKGETLDYKNTGDATIEANTVVALNTRIGVAATTIKVGEVGAIHVVGTYEMPKTDVGEIALGANVYFDGEGITATADSNTPAGYAIETSVAGATEIKVKLLG